MWQKSYSTATDLQSSELWMVISNISNWAAWDNDIEFTQIIGEPQLGSKFILKPQGAPPVELIIAEFNPPHKFVDVTQFPLAKMRTIHEFIDTPNGTEILVTIQVWGILGFLWQKIVGHKQVNGLPEQTKKFIHHARQISA
jgi:hypothetical protein